MSIDEKRRKALFIWRKTGAREGKLDERECSRSWLCDISAREGVEEQMMSLIEDNKRIEWRHAHATLNDFPVCAHQRG